MNYRRNINEQIQRHRGAFLPIVRTWLAALTLTIVLYLCGSYAVFFTKSFCFILTVVVMAAIFGGGPTCPECEKDFRPIASRYEIALRWKRLPDTVSACPRCGIHFD